MIGQETAEKLQWAFLYELKAQEEYFEIARDLDEDDKHTLEHIAEEEQHHADQIREILHKLGFRAFVMDVEAQHQKQQETVKK